MPFHDLFLTNVNQSESRNDFFTRAKPIASNQHETVFTYQRIRSGPAKFSARRREFFKLPAIFSGLNSHLSLNSMFTKIYNAM